MCTQLFFGHNGPDGSNADDRMRRAGAQFQIWAENIGHGYLTAERLHAAWMNSGDPRHREKLLDGRFSRTGVGYAHCRGHPYWTQVFAD